MNYKSLSSNVIACENFLPIQKIEELYIDLLNRRKIFNVPKWSIDNTVKQELFSEHCGGLDFWIEGQDVKNEASIESLYKWFFHQGFKYFRKEHGSEAYQFLEPPNNLYWNIHVISYNNGGYYNWHKDMGGQGNVFTFNLILNKSNKLKGGEMLFMDDGKIIEVDNQDNYMVCFPSFIPHAIKPVYTEDNKDVSFLEQRFSIQFWVRLNS